MKSRKRKKITHEQYGKALDKIMLKCGSVPDALIAMLEFSANVEIVQNVGKSKKKPTK